LGGEGGRCRTTKKNRELLIWEDDAATRRGRERVIGIKRIYISKIRHP
jgi:hypothetical protein